MPSRLTITVGDVTLASSESTEQVFKVVRQIPHESYSSSGQDNDIMLIELDVGFYFISFNCEINSIFKHYLYFSGNRHLEPIR